MLLGGNFRLFLVVLAAVLAFVSGDGVSFSRTVNSVGAGGAFSLKFTSGCSATDAYGSNNCAWGWGSTIDGSVDAHSGPLDVGSKLVVDLKVDRVIGWSFVCAACGQNCTTKVPIVDEEVNFATPPCPIPAAQVSQLFNSTLPAVSPTKGVKVTAVGTIKVVNEKGETVLDLGIDAAVQ